MISIHAPTRGATVCVVDTKKKLLFQSTLPREERPLVCFCSSDYWYFNPRSHERSDLQIFKTYLLITYFNPRSHERSDLAYSTSSASYSFYFNPRSHERSDAGVVGIAIGVVNFNPRSHERSDKNPQAVANNSNISIHAPTRGATSNSAKKAFMSDLFQSTLPREERQT